MADWIDYYDSTHTIYVSPLHRDVHFRVIARDIVAYVPAADAVVLDYSCGEALCAPEVAAACGELILAEPATGVRDRLKARFNADPKITVLSPDDLRQRPDASLDLVVMISVAQYMTPAELDAALALFRRVLKPTGTLVLGDILDPGVGMATDVMALMKLGARHGFLIDAMRGLVRTALSDYRRLRTSIGLRSYSEAEMLAKLAAAGFTATRAPANVGYNPARMTFVARPAPV
jgi:ubiquinone/menaquinone biosynthesis C-methylase UbiE